MDVLSELDKARRLVAEKKLSLEDFEALVIGIFRSHKAQQPNKTDEPRHTRRDDEHAAHERGRGER